MIHEAFDRAGISVKENDTLDKFDTKPKDTQKFLARILGLLYGTEKKAEDKHAQRALDVSPPKTSFTIVAVPNQVLGPGQAPSKVPHNLEIGGNRAAEKAKQNNGILNAGNADKLVVAGIRKNEASGDAQQDNKIQF